MPKQAKHLLCPLKLQRICGFAAVVLARSNTKEPGDESQGANLKFAYVSVKPHSDGCRAEPVSASCCSGRGARQASS